MINLRLVLTLIAAVLLHSSAASATTYYVSSGGADTNNGTAKTTPWAHAPGMVGCASNCGSTKINAGDRIILRGGDTWGQSNFTWTWTKSGTNGNPIYVGVDQTWFVGGSWSRPIFDAGGTRITGGTTNSNDFITVNANYTTFDNFEFKNHYCDAYTYHQNVVFDISGANGIDIENNYYHGWTNNLNTCFFVLATSHYPLDTSGNIVEYNVVDGSDTALVQADPNCTAGCNGIGSGIYGGPDHVRYNVFRYVTNGFVGNTDDFHDNTIEYLRRSPNASDHGNGFENNIACNAMIYNNVIRHTFWVEANGSGAHNGVTFWNAIFPGHGCTSYMFNNLIYDTTPGNVLDISHAVQQSNGWTNCAVTASYCTNAGSVVIWNNTVECGDDAGTNGGAIQACGGCDSTFEGCTIQNNHLITSNVTPIIVAGNPAGLRDHQVTQSRTAANSQGYTMGQTYSFSPVSGTVSTGTVGVNLTTSCTSVLDVCSDTNYGAAYNVTNHTASSPGRTANARPNSAWDAGAYQSNPSAPSKPAPPSGLGVTIQ